MEPSKRARFKVHLGKDIEPKIDFEVIDAVERATGVVFGAALQTGAISFHVMSQLVFHASKSVIGGLTLKSVRDYIKSEKNRGLYIGIMQALGEFFTWYASEEEPEPEEGEVVETVGESAGDS